MADDIVTKTKTYPDKVRTAMYGKEVRSSIADSIDKIAENVKDEIARDTISTSYAVNEYFDSSKLIDGYYNKGVLGYASGWLHTDFIKITDGDIIDVAFTNGNGLPALELFDENKNYISSIYGTSVGSSLKTTINCSNVAYCIYNVFSNSVHAFNEQHFIIKTNPRNVLDKVNTIDKTTNDFDNNYFDSSKLLDGYYNKGVIGYESGWLHTDFVKISNEDVISVACRNGDRLPA